MKPTTARPQTTAKPKALRGGTAPVLKPDEVAHRLRIYGTTIPGWRQLRR